MELGVGHGLLDVYSFNSDSRDLLALHWRKRVNKSDAALLSCSSYSLGKGRQQINRRVSDGSNGYGGINSLLGQNNGVDWKLGAQLAGVTEEDLFEEVTLKLRPNR